MAHGDASETMRANRLWGASNRLPLIAALSAAFGCSDPVTSERVLVTIEGFVTSERDGHALPGFQVELGEILEEPSRTVTDSSGWYRISSEAFAGPTCGLRFLVDAPPLYSEEGGVWYFGGYYHGPYRGENYNVIGELHCAPGVQRIDWTMVPKEPVSH